MKRFEKLSAITLQATNSLVGAFGLVRLLISRLSPGRSFCTSNISSPTIWLAFLLRTYLTLLKLTDAVSGDFLGDEDCLPAQHLLPTGGLPLRRLGPCSRLDLCGRLPHRQCQVFLDLVFSHHERSGTTSTVLTGCWTRV